MPANKRTYAILVLVVGKNSGHHRGLTWIILLILPTRNLLNTYNRTYIHGFQVL